MKFDEWHENACEKTVERVLKTIDKILEENEGSARLYAQDLDDLLDCWKILHHLRSEEPTK